MNKKLILAASLLLACATPMAPSFEAQAQTSQSKGAVSGVVIDEAGEPLIGANVVAKGTTKGVNTNIDGRFQLNVAPGTTLTISYVGYKTAEVKAAANMTVMLEPANQELDQIVVVGYGQQKKANLTGAVATVDVDKQLAGRPQQDVALALQGAVPGLTVTMNTGDLNGSPELRIRGVGTLSNGAVSAPLIVVDGVPVDDMSFLNPNDIQSISVLKDAASSSIYGTRAAFGVILITTKSGADQNRCTVKYNLNLGWDQATYVADYPDVPTQLRAALEGKANAGGGAVELFGMYFDKLLPYAEAWQKQNSSRKGYSPMTQFQDWNNVGDYALVDGQYYYYADFDIPGIWYNNHAFSQTHDLSINGASGKTKYYMSFGFDDKDGVTKIVPDNRKRYSATANVSTKPFEWLEVGTRVNFTRRTYTKPETYNDTQQYLWRWGSFFIPSGTIDGYDFRVVAMRKQADKRIYTTDRNRMTAFLKADVLPGLSLNADFTYAIQNYEMGWNDHSIYGYDWSGTKETYIVTPGSCEIFRENSKMNTWTLNAYANYNITVANDHNINVMVGANAEKMEYKYLSGRRGQLLDENYPELNLADPEGQSTGWSHWKKATAGYFGRVNYDYKGIYLLELNGRYDGSSSFPRNDHWAFFPSASAGYRFSEEAYFEKAKEYVSNGKIRASYGEIGNQAVGTNMFISTVSPLATGSAYWVVGNGANASKLTMYQMPTTVSSTLKWERIRTLDIGVDLGFLQNSLNLGFDWYQRDNDDMLAQAKTLPASFGASSPKVNAGSLRTKGWELSLSYNKRFGEVDAYANFSIGDAVTKVTKWNDDSYLLNSYYEGMTYGDIWGFETDRYFEEKDFTGKNADGSWNYAQGIPSQKGLENGAFHYGPGDIKFKDLDGDGEITGGVDGMKDKDGKVIGKGTLNNHGDLKVIGNTMPRYEYSFRLGAAWRGFDIDAYFQGVGKRAVWTVSSFNFPLMRSADLAVYANQTSYNKVLWNDDYTEILGYEIDQSNDYPRLFPGSDVKGTISVLNAGSQNYYPQSKYLTNMSYLRCKNLTVGYTLPANITKQIYLNKVRVYFSGQNLFLLHKGSGDLPVDPEINGSNSNLSYGTWGRTYPITRTYSCGVQVTF